ncbi:MULTISPECIES: NfeD family protein [unclassified Leptolyngbya]|uniref:NfeD family protein n=1 Tax=unclassified Leptolyngbya TaxID=2650499 RepID=UPI0016899793|nr:MULTISPECIES: NfeD family protein [unclassified Leptolyngbya]MBD1913469.1 NfeD family protein [Leptolyngbya sp. FACHB-8]MBD2156332.1 NfeD family protein [Leptolyngbya sp. FACHB-16]
MWISPDKVELFQHPVPGILEAEVSIHQTGRVKAIASSWPAELYPSDARTIAVGSPVLVMGIRGITLLVKSEF